MGAHNFNFDSKFPQNKFFSFKVCIFRRKFLTRRRFSDSPKFRGGVPPATTALIAPKYEAAPSAFRGLRRPCFAVCALVCLLKHNIRLPAASATEVTSYTNLLLALFDPRYSVPEGAQN